MGDTAVAVHPKDPRYLDLIGKTVIRPFPEAEIPVVASEHIDPEFGTGVLKVTPAHDKADFEIGLKYDLPIIDVFHPDGTLNAFAGPEFEGMDRFDARVKAAEKLESMGQLVKVEDYENNVGYSERADVPVEPRISHAVVPQVSLREGSRRSRRERPAQDPDVLDTWFSSWLWPFATMGWPEQTDTLKKFYPTTDLVTGPDIIFFWVARMIMAGYEYMGELPFKNVYFTGIIRDKQGRKMSKTLGNSPDPLVLIAQYGADALRFGTMRSAPLGQDVLFDEKDVELGRNFCNKLWNACRFRQMQGGEVQGED
jgi:valyl-tRNA synthetase